MLKAGSKLANICKADHFIAKAVCNIYMLMATTQQRLKYLLHSACAKTSINSRNTDSLQQNQRHHSQQQYKN